MVDLTYSRVNRYGKLIEFRYSSEDQYLVDSYKWSHSAKLYIRGYIADLGCCKMFHALVMNPPDGMFVDHIDGDRRNNTRSNLRLATRQENNRNKATHINNTSGTPGVAWHKQREKWRAFIMVDYKQIHLGLFLDLEEAILIRKAAEYVYFGEYRRVSNGS